MAIRYEKIEKTKNSKSFFENNFFLRTNEDNLLKY